MANRTTGAFRNPRLSSAFRKPESPVRIVIRRPLRPIVRIYNLMPNGHLKTFNPCSANSRTIKKLSLNQNVRQLHALMKKLRSIHLYLGCIFAPLLLFFALSGIWQTLGFHSDFLTRLSTIHTSHQLKNGSSLSGGLLMIFVLIMAVSFVITTILGVIMAIKHGGSRRAAYYCIAFGVAFPIALVFVRAFGMRI